MLRLLLPLDGSTCAERALPHAITLARTFEASVRLIRVVHAGDLPGADAAAIARASRQEREHAGDYLATLAERLRRAGIPCEWSVEAGCPATAIAAAARADGDQLLVMTTHGSGNAREFPRGSVASKLLANYRGSVFLLRPQALPSGGRYRRIAALIDLNSLSPKVLQCAARLATTRGSRLLVACALHEPELPAVLRRHPRALALRNELGDLLERAAAGRLAEAKENLPTGLRVETRIVRYTDLSSAVARIAVHHDIDLLVLGNDWPDIVGGCRTETVPMLFVGPRGLPVRELAQPARDGRGTAADMPDGAPRRTAISRRAVARTLSPVRAQPEPDRQQEQRLG